jgi:hypothetical protein
MHRARFYSHRKIARSAWHEKRVAIRPPMKISVTSTEAILQELAAWSQLAHDVLRASKRTLEKSTVRTAKQQLIRHHLRHVTQLRDWLRRHKASVRFTRQSPAGWAEVIEAMRSRDEYVAIASCALLERAVLAAYERAADHLWLENDAMRLVRRQRLVMKCCHSRYLRRPTPSRDRATHTAAARRPAFVTSLAVAG